MPQIKTRLLEEIQAVFDKAVEDFRKVMSQYMVVENINTSGYIAETEIDLSQNIGKVLLFIIAWLTIVPGIIATIIKTNWSYDEAMQDLAIEWSTKFDRSVKYRISYELGTMYQNMVSECELRGYTVKEKIDDS